MHLFNYQGREGAPHWPTSPSKSQRDRSESITYKVTTNLRYISLPLILDCAEQVYVQAR